MNNKTAVPHVLPDVRPPQKKGGRWRCRACSKPCPGRRRSWCSDQCKHAGQWTWWKKRDAVFYRDAGICELCLLDTEKLRRVLNKMIRDAGTRARRKGESNRDYMARLAKNARYRAMVKRVADHGFAKCFRPSGSDGTPMQVKSFWEADHIEPRILGGKDDVKNMRTLCVPCHRYATRRLAKYRATRRKKQLHLYAPETYR